MGKAERDIVFEFGQPFRILGIEQPPLGEVSAEMQAYTQALIDRIDPADFQSKKPIVIYAAKRARQINAYYSQLGEGLLEYVGPQVESVDTKEPVKTNGTKLNGHNGHNGHSHEVQLVELPKAAPIAKATKR